MDFSESIITTLTSYLAQSPIFLVWLVGIVLAGVRWSQHPKVSLLTIIALAVMLLTSLVSIYLNVQIPLLMTDWGWDYSQISLFFMIKGFVQAAIDTVAFVLLFMAIFGERTAKQ
ncbi:MAG: hypothetical protein U0401_35560 [Anaerolineae bacterium]